MAKLNKLGVENSLWNNIRAKRGSGKKPTKEMLKQEAKIKKEEAMNKYKDGGKKSARLNKRADKVMSKAQKNWKKGQDAMEDEAKSSTSIPETYASQKLNKAARQAERAKKLKEKASFLEESKEVEFGYPSMPKKDEKMMGGKKKLYKAGGKSKFQEMAAKGRARKEKGGFDDDMEMENTVTMDDRGKNNASAKARKRGKKARIRQKRGRTGCYSGECMDVPMI
jgi:hypothetical protein